MSPSTPDSDDSRIEEILEQWFELQMAGAEPQLEELAKGAPHLIERVRAMLERQGELLGPVEATGSRRPLPVDKLGDYELKSRIGSGGMGDVYLAREVALDRMVAVKVLRQELAEDRLRRLRFKREAQLTAALDHPNIVPIYGTGEDDGYVFLVMKLLPGVALDRIPGPWQPREIAAIGVQIGRALHAAHEVEIVHRDIKPGNIQVDGDDAWVLDFGLARGRVDLTLTAHGEAPGTLAYMPPEQLRGSPGGLDPRGDVYSLAATLYQCVAGRPPFEADSPEVLVRQALLHDPKPLDVPVADRDFWTVIQRALEKDPERRFSTALQFAEDLERFLAGDPIQSRPPSTLTRCVKLARRYRTVTASLMAVLLVLLVVIPKLWLDAEEREADFTRQMNTVQGFLDRGVPAMALVRVQELEERNEASGSRRFGRLASETRATLIRDALLDRIQLDCVYRQTLVDEEFTQGLAAMPEALRVDSRTLIASMFVARAKGEGVRLERLLKELEASGDCLRLTAAWRAAISGQGLEEVLVKAVPGGMPVEDHVFTAVLLRLTDAPSELVRREIKSAIAAGSDHPRARLMMAIWHLIGGATKRAAEVFQLLVDRERPRAEVQSALAVLANLDGDSDRAQKHLRLARAALEATERSASRWIVLPEVLQLILSGQLDAAGEALTRAREMFGEDEWLLLAQARLHVERGDRQAGRELFGQLMTQALLPWNRRRAAAAALEIDADLGGEVTLPQLERLINRAEALASEAEAVDDDSVFVVVMGARARLAYVLHEAFASNGMDEKAKEWGERHWNSLERVLAVADLHQESTLLAAEYVSHQIVDVMKHGGDALAVGDRAARIRRRAVALTRRGYYDNEPVERLASLAAFAAVLSAYVKDAPDALQMGAIARALLRQGVLANVSDTGPIESLLDQALHQLGRDKWPEVPPRVGKPK